ncbi:hypothetical protein HLB42_21600 (plasmid) [Deinococcus sp. D7000]|nr:hypothetical protein HLB42_13875 [Deinococcus sp. D7000]QLG13537.1 hypothetical protein HLB42_21600 [Deinococcus sp. D7000]
MTEILSRKGAARVTRADVADLQRRATEWPMIGGPEQQRIQAQADAAYQLSLVFFRLAIGGDFPRWLSQHSGVNRETCRVRYKLGVAREVDRERGVTRRRNQSGLLTEQRERETTPVPELSWEGE